LYLNLHPRSLAAHAGKRTCDRARRRRGVALKNDTNSCKHHRRSRDDKERVANTSAKLGGRATGGRRLEGLHAHRREARHVAAILANPTSVE
jgi:hypothetical protein